MKKNRILIVEDEAIIGMHLKSSLAGLGYDVVGLVKNAEEALRECGAQRPDLILMDIVMPGAMDGIEAARVIMKTYDIPVVYLTGNADMATVARARETNPYGYVIKPINAQHLFSTIDTALHRRALEMELRDSEEKYRRIAENMVDLISWVDRDDNFTYVSPSHRKILGYDPADLCRMKFFDVVHPEDKKMVVDAYRHFIGKEPFIRGEYRCRAAGGGVSLDGIDHHLPVRARRNVRRRRFLLP
ncbi:MAG TPA: response regulator [Spirochaetota bacterium]|nr:response regulator [Spirochaetota bacterium]HPC41588.1 response regulator [Spirochaetota bacterium]HQF08302.1 response regulator [Spirochaetota bacterium]HQH97083.1 response regulator [Spirochaetota bacterium]